ncbi:hypothetical protein, partial [Bartonella sp. TT29SHDZB]|uniref:hypothetical protein n=1 Tax=Bartonella sp. TT29SHDZB TaxID=3243581 RepID=UPI0035D05F3E
MTRGSSSSPLLNPDPEVERNFRRKLRQVHLSDSGSVEVSVEVNQEVNMAENQQQSISDFARPNFDGTGSSIVRPP